MSFPRLAAVEVQLIMQFQTRSEIAQLARCSRAMLTAADAPHVWQFVEPIRVPADAVPPISPPLLRHVPVTLVWNPPEELSDGLAIGNQFLSRVAAYRAGRVHGVDAWRSQQTIPWEDWAHVLSDPRLHQLRFIAMHPPSEDEFGVPASLFVLMAALPLLHTLRCSDVGFEPDGSSALLSLPLYPALTSLQIAAYWAVFQPWQMQPVTECRHLRRLSWTVGGESFPELQQSPLLAHLEWLELRWIMCRDVADWHERFAAIRDMCSLKELHLSIPHNGGMLPSSFISFVPLLPPSLRLIAVRPALADGEPIALWAGFLLRMLTHSPERLRFLLRVRPSRTGYDQEAELQNARDLFVAIAKSSDLQPFKDNGRFELQWQLEQPQPIEERTEAN